MQLVKTISTDLDKLKRRVVKFLRFGKSDTQTSLEAAPFGVDSNPIKDMVAVYSETTEKGKTVILGYLNKNVLAKVGEFRTFSTDEQGEEKFYIWQKNDGTCEIGGKDDNLVRFKKLDEAMTKLATDINLQLVAIATGITAGGGSYAPTNIDIDISAAKITEIKTL